MPENVNNIIQFAESKMLQQVTTRIMIEVIKEKIQQVS